jgi:hypothetical protein
LGEDRSARRTRCHRILHDRLSDSTGVVTRLAHRTLTTGELDCISGATHRLHKIAGLISKFAQFVRAGPKTDYPFG